MACKASGVSGQPGNCTYLGVLVGKEKDGGHVSKHWHY